jgi:hypothetical protein
VYSACFLKLLLLFSSVIVIDFAPQFINFSNIFHVFLFVSGASYEHGR